MIIIIINNNNNNNNNNNININKYYISVDRNNRKWTNIRGKLGGGSIWAILF